MKLILVGLLSLSVLANCQFTSKDESDSITNHAFEIYKKIFDSSKNLVYSPLSFRVLYSILYQTSFGETENELRQQLFPNGTRGADKRSMQSMQSTTLERILSSNHVKLANKVYLVEGVTLKPNFISLVAQYKSEVEQVDFSQSTKVANKMNQWVEEKTNRLIKNLISVDSVNPDAKLFLINSLYFKSDWLDPFGRSNVMNSTFRNIDGSKTVIKFIADEDYYAIAMIDELRVHVIELPYERESNFKFWIIIPRDGLSLDELKSQLSTDFIESIRSSLVNQNTQIKFPIFTIESEIDGRSISKVLFERAELNILEYSNPLSVDEIK